MSFWRRMRSWLSEDENKVEVAVPGTNRDQAIEPVKEFRSTEAEPSNEAKFDRLLADPDGATDVVALQLFDRLAHSGRELRAIELSRRLLDSRPELVQLSLRVAERLSARGEDEEAFDQLRPMLASRAPSMGVFMLAGEISERRGDRSEALAFYERVLARDVDYPRAKERAARLRTEHREPNGGLAGATLMADGAMARGRYRIQRELGRGGAGTVFAARDVELNREVALKVYHRQGRADRQRLELEARTPANLEHPGVIRIFDLDLSLGAIVMEALPAGSVRQALGKGSTSPDRVRTWFRTMLESLAYVHRNGWVHRDLKPSNFLLRDDDRIVLTDFGLAARVGDATSAHVTGGEGTLAYMAPEQRTGRAAQPAADVYALGAGLREILDHVAGNIEEKWLEWALACMREKPESRPTVAELQGALVLPE